MKVKFIRFDNRVKIPVRKHYNDTGADIFMLDDDWTICTNDDSNSAHFEHTILVTKDGYEILTGE